MLNTQWHQRRRGSHGQRGDRQRGAAIVETGLIFPLLMFLVFGIIEIGGLLSTYSAGANAVRAGGRMASVQGTDASADQATLARIAQESTAIRNGEIRYIIVWHAESPSSTVPSACVSAADALGAANQSSVGRTVGGAAGDCNIYAYPQSATGAFAMATGQAGNPDPNYYFGCTGSGDPEASHKVDCYWPAGDRETVISPRGVSPRVEPDYVGIYIRIDYRYLTGLLGTERTITDNSITLLEPDNFETD